MGFEKVYITEGGMALEAKARSGKSLKLLRVEIGDGNLETANISEQTAVVNKIMECSINSISEVNNQTIINFVLEQNKVDNGFYFREFGVVAQEPDTLEEVLYLYANAGSKAEFIKDKTAIGVSDKVIDIIVKEENADNITISIDNTGVFVQRDEFQAKIQELEMLKANKKKVYNIALDTEGWSETVPYTKTIAVEGILTTDEPNLKPVWSEELETRQAEKENYNKISKLDTIENGIILTCDEEKPDGLLNIKLEVTY